MNVSAMWNPAAFPDMMALFGTMALVIGGVVLVVAAGAMRSPLMARRVDLILPRGGAIEPSVSSTAYASEVEHLPAFTAGLSEPEQREIIRLLSRMRVPRGQAVLYFIIGRVTLSASLGLLALLYVASRASLWWLPFIVAAGAAIVGWIAPIFLIGLQIRRHGKSVASGLPDALELLVVCVEAGLSLEDGLRRVADELAESQSELADEIKLTWAEINILPSRAQALANLADRIDFPSVKSVVNILSQSMQFGTPLAQTLRVAASEMRNDHMLRLEERAGRLPALLTIPVMIFLMPTIFLIIGGPAILRLIDVFQRVTKFH
ncbi:MAG: type II secretion system F family protein [Methylovirgula sp.]